MLQNIASEAQRLQSEAAMLASLSSTLAERAEQQRMENTQLAAAITEMSSSAQEVASNTHDCASTAQSSLVVVREGQTKLAANSQAIQALAAANQPARPERRHRSGAGRRTRPRLCRGGR